MIKKVFIIEFPNSQKDRADTVESMLNDCIDKILTETDGLGNMEI